MRDGGDSSHYRRATKSEVINKGIGELTHRVVSYFGDAAGHGGRRGWRKGGRVRGAGSSE